LIIRNYTGGMKDVILFIHILSQQQKIKDSLLTWFKTSLLGLKLFKVLYFPKFQVLSFFSNLIYVFLHLHKKILSKITEFLKNLIIFGKHFLIRKCSAPMIIIGIIGLLED
jgi:hypothetical protein